MAARTGLLVAILSVTGCCLDIVSGSELHDTTAGGGTFPISSSTGSSGSIGGSAGSTSGSSGSGDISSTGSSGQGSSTGAAVFGFLPAVSYSVGLGPFSIAVADYNLDHKLDLAVANHGDGTVSLLLGNGDGTFQLPAQLPIGGAPYWIEATDLNADGRPDLAIASSDSDAVVVFINDAGGFGDPVAYPAGAGPNCVVAADFNGDGLPDLATSNYGDSTVSILWATGSGRFTTGQTLSGFQDPIFVAVLPGGPLAVVDQHADEVDVYPSAEDGDFSGMISSGSGSWPTSMAVGDLNHDGLPDLAMSDWNGGVSVLLGIAGGGFATAANYPAGSTPNSVVMADFNLDGNLDLAVANADSLSSLPGVVSVFLGFGDGTFGTPMTLAVGAGPVDVAVGDFNGDGSPDLAVANNSDNTISILLTTP